MVAMPKQNVPTLRLEGFNGEWSQSVLGSFARKVNEKNVDLSVAETFTNSAEKGVISQTEYFKHQVSNDMNLGGYYVVQPNDFIYNPRISTGAPVGPINRNKLERVGVVSPLYTVFRISLIDHSFLDWFFKSPYWHGFMRENGDSGARGDRLSIGQDLFFQMLVATPPTFEEQQAIGAIFTNLDAAINQHMLKHKALQQAKTALMQRMFPQEGQTVPELRLEGFSGEWEETTLGELGAFRSGVGFPEREQGGTIGLPFYKVSDLSAPGNELQLQSANHYVTEGQIVRNHWTPVTAVPAILFAKVGAAVFLGRKRLVNNAFLLDNNLMAFSLNTESWDVQFADTYLKTVDLTQFAQSGALPSLNARHLAEAEAIIPPTLEEQQAIGAIFTKLDQLIAAEAQYIASLKQAKTALLQRMFI